MEACVELIELQWFCGFTIFTPTPNITDKYLNLIKFSKSMPFGSNLASGTSISKVPKWDNYLRSARLSLVFLSLDPSTSHPVKLFSILKYSNWDKLDMIFGGITWSLEQLLKSNNLRWISYSISLGNCSILEPIRLRDSNFFSSEIIAISPNMH